MTEDPVDIRYCQPLHGAVPGGDACTHADLRRGHRRRTAALEASIMALELELDGEPLALKGCYKLQSACSDDCAFCYL